MIIALSLGVVAKRALFAVLGPDAFPKYTLSGTEAAYGADA
jgi:hypothetical protein